MSVFHGEFPKVPLHFTEGSVFGLQGGVELIEKLRNRTSSYNAWVAILNDNGNPNNGPFEASRTIVTLDPGTQKPKEHFDFFLYGLFMKFIQRSAVQVESAAEPRDLASAAFPNPDGQIVLVMVEPGRTEASLALHCAGREAPVGVPGKSVATFLWQ